MDRRAAACRNARHPDRWSFPASAARVRAAHGLTRRAGLSAARRRGVVIRRSGRNVARGLAAGVTAKFEPRRLKLEVERGNADVELRARNEKFKALSSHAAFRLN